MPKSPFGQERPTDVVGCVLDVASIATGEVDDAHCAPQNRHKSGVADKKTRLQPLDAVRRLKRSTKAEETRWLEKEGV